MPTGVYERQKRKATCCPQKPHYGLGMCYECYTKHSTVKRKEYHKKWNMLNKIEIQKKLKQKRDSQRLIVYKHYSGGKPRCACCGDEHMEFLTIDHINGDGKKHRYLSRNRTLYKWIIDNNFPKDLRILCMNCNWSHGKHGYCPHNN